MTSIYILHLLYINVKTGVQIVYVYVFYAFIKTKLLLSRFKYKCSYCFLMIHDRQYITPIITGVSWCSDSSVNRHTPRGFSHCDLMEYILTPVINHVILPFPMPNCIFKTIPISKLPKKITMCRSKQSSLRTWTYQWLNACVLVVWTMLYLTINIYYTTHRGCYTTEIY